MTPDEARGRRVVVTIALLVGAPTLLIAVVATVLAAPHTSGLWMTAGVNLFLAVVLYQGYGWARGYLAFCYMVGGALLLLRSLSAGRSPIPLIRFPVAALMFAVGIVLWKSKSVEAYFARQEETRDPIFSRKPPNGE